MSDQKRYAIVAHMKKYVRVFCMSLKSTFSYRWNALMGIFAQLITIGALLFVWIAIYDEQTTIVGFTLGNMLAYTTIAYTIRRIQISKYLDTVSDEIKDGKVNFLFVKPISFTWYTFFRDWGNFVFLLLTSTLFIAALFIALKEKISFPGFHMGILAFIPAVLLSTTLASFIYKSISYLSFWLTQVKALSWSTTSLISVLSGSLFPLALYPEWIQKILHLLPFRQMAEFPTQLFLHTLTPQNIFEGFLLQIFWIFIFIGITHGIWKRGVKHYEGAGI